MGNLIKNLLMDRVIYNYLKNTRRTSTFQNSKAFCGEVIIREFGNGNGKYNCLCCCI
jgi:hypothetical protein